MYLRILLIFSFIPYLHANIRYATKPLYSGLEIAFSVNRVNGLLEGNETTISFNASGICRVPNKIVAFTDNNKVAKVVNIPKFDLDFDENSGWCSGESNVTLKGLRLGRTKLIIKTEAPNEYERSTQSELEIVVLRTRNTRVQVYLLVTVLFLVLLTFGYGCQIDKDILLQILKKPVPPFVGFLCQFLLMPLLGFSLSRVLQLENAFGFGLLLYSCSPGGGMSNVWTAIWGGDVTLSLLMTFLSTLCSLGMMPLWVYLHGGFFVDPVKVPIPFTEIMKSLAFLVLPCLFGFLVNTYKKEIGKQFVKASKPIGLLYLCYQFIANAFVNAYIFEIMIDNPKIIIAALLLPFCAFVFGYVTAVLARQSKPRSLTIAVETGVQNVGIPVVMLMYAFPPPEGDLGAVVPIASAYLMSILLFLAWFITTIYKKVTNKQSGTEGVEGVESIENCDGKVQSDGKYSSTPSVDEISDVFEEDKDKEVARPKTYVFVTDVSDTKIDDKLSSV